MAPRRSATVASLIGFYSVLAFLGFADLERRNTRIQVEQERRVEASIRNRVGGHNIIVNLDALNEPEPALSKKKFNKSNMVVNLENPEEPIALLSPPNEKAISSMPVAPQKPIVQTPTKQAFIALSYQASIRRGRLDSATAALAAPGYPPLSSLIDNMRHKITGDVQFLLHYAVIGFSKCGTTTVSKWLDTHPEVSDFDHEVWDNFHRQPVKLVKRLYKKLPYFANNDEERKRRIRGYKCPGDITRPKVLHALGRHWPKTKLIISLRHPVRFFESFYNYRVSLTQWARIPGTPNELIGPETQYDVLATAQSAFHVFLASLGKTDMSTADEMALLTGFYRDRIMNVTSARQRQGQARVPNQVFLVEMTQLADYKNKTRSHIFRKDLENFLGLQHPLDVEVPFHRPNAKIEKQITERQRRQKRRGVLKKERGERPKIDICDDEHFPVRQELMRISRSASRWIREYFLHSPDVVVSSPEFFVEILQSWMEDPCDKAESSKYEFEEEDMEVEEEAGKGEDLEDFKVDNDNDAVADAEQSGRLWDWIPSWSKLT